MTIAVFAMLAALQASPAPAAPPAAAATASPAPLPTDPEQLARQQFAAFASGNIDQRWYSQPIPAAAIAQLRQYLPGLGTVKSFTLIKQNDTPNGPGYAYRVSCAQGTVIEQFTVKNGTITGIYFSPAQ